MADQDFNEIPSGQAGPVAGLTTGASTSSSSTSNFVTEEMMVSAPFFVEDRRHCFTRSPSTAGVKLVLCLVYVLLIYYVVTGN